MSAVWDSPIGPATRRLVLLALADSANDQGVCWPSVPTIARKANCSVSAARAAVAELEKQGIVIRQARPVTGAKNRSNLYRVVVSALPQALPPESGGSATEDWGDLPPDLVGTPTETGRHNHHLIPNLETSPEPNPSPDGDDGLFAVPAGALPKDEAERVLGYKKKQGQPTNDELDSEFDAWWLHVPRKVGKDAARVAYRAARRRGATGIGLANAMDQQAARYKVQRTDKQYIPHPSTWLNSGRWQDEADEVVPSVTAKTMGTVARATDWSDVDLDEDEAILSQWSGKQWE